MKKLLTTEELCEYLQVNEQTLGRLRRKGLPYFKIGGAVRFDVNEVLEWTRKEEREKNDE